MALTADTFVRGHEFDGASGLKDGSQLEDLVTQATPTNGSELVDQSTLETFLDAVLAVYRLRVKDGGISTAKLAAGILSADAAGLAKMADGYLAASTAARAKMADGFVTGAKLAADSIQSETGLQFVWVYQTVAIAVTQGAWNVVALSGEERDPAGVFASNQYQPTVEGLYQVVAVVRFNDVGSWAKAGIFKNALSTPELEGPHWDAAANVPYGCGISGVVYLNGSSDYLRLKAWPNDSGRYTAGTTKYETYFQAWRLARTV
jgi:hypothetical protein